MKPGHWIIIALVVLLAVQIASYHTSLGAIPHVEVQQ